MDKEIVNYLIEIKEELGQIRADIAVVQDKMEIHSINSKNTAEKVAQLEKDAWKAKGAIAFIAFLGTLIGLYKLLV